MQAEEASLYFDIPVEWFFETILVPFLGHSITYEAMMLFGGYHLPTAVALSCFGVLVASTFNWIVGRAILRFQTHVKPIFSPENYSHLGGLMRKYGWAAIPFFWVAGGAVFVVAAGFFGLRWWLTTLLVLLGHGLHLAYFIGL